MLKKVIYNLSEFKAEMMKSVMCAFFARYKNMENAFDAMDVEKTGYITIEQVGSSSTLSSSLSLIVCNV